MTGNADHQRATEPEDLLASNPTFEGEPRPAIRNGDLALTSPRIPGGATVEIARRQPDGIWLWVVDQPSALREGMP